MNKILADYLRLFQHYALHLFRNSYRMKNFTSPMVSCLILISVLVSGLPNCAFAQDYQTLIDGMWQRALTRSFETTTAPVAVPEERLRPFYHGVASGDPQQDRVIIWTRVTPEDNAPVIVSWRVARDTGFTDVVTRGTITTDATRDYTVKVDVTGLQPATVYYYDFMALGKTSLPGRMRTLPAAEYTHARFALVSCSNFPSGFFNAYGRIAERNDIDAVIHVGDYIYEYATDTVGGNNATTIRMQRIPSPNKEILSLNDYRTRYAQYRLDPDLRRLHQQHPFITVWDDHESANDAWKDGAQNHTEGAEGKWTDRKSISKRVYYEWMPIREQSDTTIYRHFSFGSLVDLLMIDTRLQGRDLQVLNVGPNAPQASIDSLTNPQRTILGSTQYAWLTQKLRESTATWKILGNQVMFSPMITSPFDTVGLSPTAQLFLPFIKPLLEGRFATDLWSNYPAEQQRLMAFIRSSSLTNVVFATGDFHTSFGHDVTENPTTYNGSGLAVEFLTPSITSTNFDELANTVPPGLSAQLAALLAQATPELFSAFNRTLEKNNPQMKFYDLTNHGYILLDCTPERIQGDWYYVDTLYVRSPNERRAKSLFTLTGQSRLQSTNLAATGKPIQDTPAPLEPSSTPVSVKDNSLPDQEQKSNIIVISTYPLPASTLVTCTYAIKRADKISISLYNLNGKMIRHIYNHDIAPGLYSLALDVSDVAQGQYTLEFMSNLGEVLHRTITVVR